MKVHKGDTVLVISGKDKGAKGKVLQAYPEREQGARRGRQPHQEAHRHVAPTSVARSPAASSPRKRPST